MHDFTNEKLDTAQLPRYEEVQLTSLHPKYWWVLLLNFSVVFLIIGIALGLIWYNSEEFQSFGLYFVGGYFTFLLLSLLLTSIAYKKKAFAFRNHDVIYRSGIIATNTMVIPYNRVQHVALHEGFIARIFGLAKVEIFTAGGNASDLEIPGIAKEEAENIKQLLMGKIQKQL